MNKIKSRETPERKWFDNSINTRVKQYSTERQIKCNLERQTHARHITRFSYILGDKSLQATDNLPNLGVPITKYFVMEQHIHHITLYYANKPYTCIRKTQYFVMQTPYFF